MSLILTILTFFHVAISLIGIAAGLVAVFGLMKAKWLNGWNLWFLVSTITTTLTGFLFPFHKLLPSHVVGVISAALLATAVFALYKGRLAGGWRRTYVVTAVIALYLNSFVLVVQLFLKVPALKALAPTQTESPFKLAQGVTLVAFILLGVFAARGFSIKQASRA